MLYGGQNGQKNSILKLHTLFCLFVHSVNFCHLVVKIIGLSSLESLLLFWIPSLSPFQPCQTHPCSAFRPSSILPSFVSMPRPRESLNTVKTRLALEQKIRTDRRIQALLHPRQTGQDVEVFDDSEEEDRLIGRRERARRDQGGLTGISVRVCLVCVCLVVIFVYCLFLHQTNAKQRMAE